MNRRSTAFAVLIKLGRLKTSSPFATSTTHQSESSSPSSSSNKDQPAQSVASVKSEAEQSTQLIVTEEPQKPMTYLGYLSGVISSVWNPTSQLIVDLAKSQTRPKPK